MALVQRLAQWERTHGRGITPSILVVGVLASVVVA